MSIFYYCIYNNIDEFIDWENSTCKFDSEDFIRVLEFANKFPEEPDYSEEDEGTSAKLRSDKLLLMQTSLSSVQEYQMMNGLFGEKVSYIGYPNSERKGNLIQASNGCVAINAKSKHKDGAWEFIKTMISGEYQDSLVDKHGSWGFPVKKSALEKQFEADMTPEYYEDENGNKVMDQMSKEETMKTVNDISSQYGENVIVQFSGDALAALADDTKMMSGREMTEEEKLAFLADTKGYSAHYLKLFLRKR